MAYKELFFAQPFEINAKFQMLPGASYECDDASHAIRRAKAFSEKTSGAIAFSQMVETRTGDAEEPTILFVSGCVPKAARDTIVRYEGSQTFSRTAHKG